MTDDLLVFCLPWEIDKAMSRTPVLLSKSLDPLLGVFTGVLAYYLHEANPRSAPPPGESLSELVRWKKAKWDREREEKLEAQDEMSKDGR